LGFFERGDVLAQDERILKYQHFNWKSHNSQEFDPQVAKYHLFSNLSVNFAKGILSYDIYS